MGLKLLKRHQAIEPIIGHLKADHRLNRCHLKGEIGDRIHAVLCATGYNIRWLLRMIIKKGLRALLRLARLTSSRQITLPLTLIELKALAIANATRLPARRWA
jgi:IS5 family transposase